MKKNNTWNIRRLVDKSFVPANQRTSVLYCRLSDFLQHLGYTTMTAPSIPTALSERKQSEINCFYFCLTQCSLCPNDILRCLRAERVSFLFYNFPIHQSPFKRIASRWRIQHQFFKCCLLIGGLTIALLLGDAFWEYLFIWFLT